jgi:hypothetical protein
VSCADIAAKSSYSAPSLSQKYPWNYLRWFALNKTAQGKETPATHIGAQQRSVTGQSMLISGLRGP